ncbi:DUF378 domain-containing protein [Sporosarcina sp. ANT_H38]|uniref:DUF378 domain-containing protein n=1 Tax=Sporosarcina sp. ANT_H38 TaxID=2597358 RepID=UPI0011F39A1A|nr:DUF378 domain-containing protein [Sporosarcina sp. ANT_H38]KAA0944005.1 DUF378 domain-containing protein [Sporosarcina sp. ANT_H38]
MGKVHKLALAITIIGALNWGVAGIFRFDVVAQFAGGFAEPLARFIYIIIGISGLLNLGLLFDQSRNRHEEIVPVPEKA